jgi:type III secretion protein C
MALRWFSRIEIAPLAIAIAIAIAAIGVGPASATEPKWASKNFVYRAENKRLPDVIQDFASSQGLAVITDAALEGTVNVSFNRSPSEFMSTLSKSYGVIWYFDGVSLFAYPARAMQSKVFRLRGFKREQVRQMLESLGLGDSRYPLRYNDAEQTLVAYGPPRHIELVSTVVSTLDQRYGNGGASEVVVVPLKFAFAADRGVGAARVKGLVSTLNSIYGGGGGAGGGGAGSGMAAEAGVVTQARQSAEANLGVPLTPQRRALEGQGQRASASSSGQPPASSAKGRQGIDVSERGAEAPESAAPLFQADEATNSVLVRAPVDQMPKYTALIRKLDVAQDLVEIEVTIIDVSSDDFDALGVDWNFTNASGSFALSVSPGAPSSSSSGGSLTTSAIGANITTLIADAGRVLMTRVRALESRGKARVMSRGRLLGAANHTASMSDKRSVSVRVAGNLEANLYTVEAGTSLQVLPQIVRHAGTHDIRLTLSIRDGSFEGSVVDNVPTVKSTEIQTNATVPEGESLLIGGITSEIDSNGYSGVKGLSRIPLLGGIFRREEGSKFRSERMFLLTPKLIRVTGSNVDVASIQTGAAAPRPGAARTASLDQRTLEVAASAPAPTKPAAPAPAAVPAPAAIVVAANFAAVRALPRCRRDAPTWPDCTATLLSGY